MAASLIEVATSEAIKALDAKIDAIAEMLESFVDDAKEPAKSVKKTTKK